MDQQAQTGRRPRWRKQVLLMPLERGPGSASTGPVLGVEACRAPSAARGSATRGRGPSSLSHRDSFLCIHTVGAGSRGHAVAAAGGAGRPRAPRDREQLKVSVRGLHPRLRHVRDSPGPAARLHCSGSRFSPHPPAHHGSLEKQLRDTLPLPASRHRPPRPLHSVPAHRSLRTPFPGRQSSWSRGWEPGRRARTRQLLRRHKEPAPGWNARL